MSIAGIKQFWVNSYTSDRTAFWFELIGFIFTVASSLYLAINAFGPDMRIVYSISFVGVICQAYAGYRREAAWVFLLTVYFAFISLFGFGRAVGWY